MGLIICNLQSVSRGVNFDLGSEKLSKVEPDVVTDCILPGQLELAAF